MSSVPRRPARTVVAALVGWLLAGAGLRAEIDAVRLEFAAPEAAVRSFQPMRLVLDLTGPVREVQVRLELPPGAYILRPVERIPAGGGRPQIHLLNVFVPAGTAAGSFVVSGEARDPRRVWPLRASLQIRSVPGLRLERPPSDPVIVPAAAAARASFTVVNSGNAALDFVVTPLLNPALAIRVSPSAFTLDPGGTRELEVSSRLASPATTLREESPYVTIEARQQDYLRRETVGFAAAFVPENPDPGPLFSQLEGEMLVAGLASERTGMPRGLAGRFSVAGDLTNSLRLEASGADGRPAAGGSRLGFADRDYARIALLGAWGRMEGGLVSPPSFGVLEPAPHGRGSLAQLALGEWALTALATRDAYGSYVREHVGLHARQPDGGWELGLLAQRNHYAGTPEVRRFGGFAQRAWTYGRLKAATQLTAADADNDRSGLRPAGEQRLEWAGERLRVNGNLQLAATDFDLAGRSSRYSNLTIDQDTALGRWYARGNWSRDQGTLELAEQRLRERGRVPPSRQALEIITLSSSYQRSGEAGFARTTGAGVFSFGAAHNIYATVLRDTMERGETYGVLAWVQSAANWFGRAELDLGTERAPGESADFAEFVANYTGRPRPDLSFTLDLRQTWNLRGFSTGFRRPGTYGQLSLVWEKRPGSWRAETGINAYAYRGLDSRVQTYLQVECPVSPRFRLGLETTWENRSGPHSVWAFIRVPLRVPLSWRPVRGALTGRVTDQGGRAVAGAYADLDGRRALTDAAGRFVLPAMPPGRYPLAWRLPGGWAAGPDWPREIELQAGRRDTVELQAQRLAGLRGEVVVNGGVVPVRPTGAVRATDGQGRFFETPVTDGRFLLRLPPGRYTLQFSGEVAAAVAERLVAEVTVGADGAEATVLLEAFETPRRMRQTLFPDQEN